MEKINIVKKLVEDYSKNKKRIFNCINMHAAYMQSIIINLIGMDNDRFKLDNIKDYENELDLWNDRFSDCYQKINNDAKLKKLVDNIYNNSIYYYQNSVRIKTFEENIKPLLFHKNGEVKKIKELNKADRDKRDEKLIDTKMQIFKIFRDIKNYHM